MNGPLSRRPFSVGAKRSRPQGRLVTSWNCKAYFTWSLLRGRFEGFLPKRYAILKTPEGYRSYQLPNTGEAVGFAEACQICPHHPLCQSRLDIREFWIPE